MGLLGLTLGEPGAFTEFGLMDPRFGDNRLIDIFNPSALLVLLEATKPKPFLGLPPPLAVGDPSPQSCDE